MNVNSPKPPNSNTFSFRKKYNSTKKINNKNKHFRAAEELRGVMMHVEQMETLIREFLKNNLKFKNFAVKWKTMKVSFDTFIEIASVHFASKNPKNDFRSSQKSTSIHNCSNRVIQCWGELIKETDSVEEIIEEEIDENSILYEINNKIDEIHTCIEKTRELMPSLRFRTDIACVKIDKFQENVNSFYEEIYNFYLLKKKSKKNKYSNIHQNNQEKINAFNNSELTGNNNNDDFNELNKNSNNELAYNNHSEIYNYLDKNNKYCLNHNLDEKRLHEQINYLNRSAFEIYGKALKHSSVNLAAKIKERTELSAHIADLEDIITSEKKKEYFIRSFKEEIVKANQCFSTIFQKMHFPFIIEIVFEDENEDSIPL